MTRYGSALATGVTAGLLAGIPQVLVTQAEARVVGLPRRQADIGPRFVKRVAQRFVGAPPSRPTEWALATLFHFGYAALWGGLYALAQSWRPTHPVVGGSALALLIYGAAFSPWGAATRTRTERPPGRRRVRETLMHWTAALSFSLTTAYTFAWLRRRRASTERPEWPEAMPDRPAGGKDGRADRSARHTPAPSSAELAASSRTDR